MYELCVKTLNKNCYRKGKKRFFFSCFSSKMLFLNMVNRAKVSFLFWKKR